MHRLAVRARRLGTIVILWGLLTGLAAAQETPAHRWSPAVAQTLVAYIERIDRQGLTPADYDPQSLQKAIASGDPASLERQATASFGLLARDLATGRVRPERRGRYFIASDRIDPARVALLIDRAQEDGTVARQLDALAPRDPQYAALVSALAALPAQDAASRTKLLATLERWRWLPRDLGGRHLLVDIPAYRADLFSGGKLAASHRVIVGKTSTPTPQFSALVEGIILNPSWHVPQSIIAESVGSLVRGRPAVARARGYTWTSRGGHLQVTQVPGPTNSLGQIKLDMPNPLSVYLHDTPSKDLFERAQRTFSHGCIRTDHPFDLAVELLSSRQWDRQAIDAVVAGRQTTRVPLSNPVPVYVVYMTAAAGADGQVEYFGDPYKLDAKLIAELSRAR